MASEISNSEWLADWVAGEVSTKTNVVGRGFENPVIHDFCPVSRREHPQMRLGALNPAPEDAYSA